MENEDIHIHIHTQWSNLIGSNQSLHFKRVGDGAGGQSSRVIPQRVHAIMVSSILSLNCYSKYRQLMTEQE